MREHLKDRKYYEDLYDRHTVKFCRRFEKSLLESFYKSIAKEYPKATLERLRQTASSWMVLPMYLEVGDRYKQREKTIEKWMKDDRRRDEKLANTPDPKMRCQKCSMPMDVVDKYLDLSFDNQPERVIFWLQCKDCNVRRVVYDDGTEKDLNSYCEKCSGLMKRKSVRKKSSITTIYTCTKCGYEEKDVFDLNEPKASKPQPDPKEEVQFEYDKERFCLSPDKGIEYLNQTEKLDRLLGKVKNQEDNRDVYKNLAKLRRINIADVKKLLTDKLNKSGYTKFDLGKSDLSKNIVVEFTVQDEQSDRYEYDSKKSLADAINDTLVDTNWILMSEGISYRMGFLSGRLKGIENEDELLKIVEKRYKKAKKTQKKSSNEYSL